MARALSRGRLPWHHGLPAITAEIDCGGQTHRITWRRGRLVLEDHDALAERALTSLGADPPVCIELLDAWRTERRVGLLFELLMRESTLPPAELLRRRASYEGMKRSAQQARANPSTPPGAVSQYRQRAVQRAAQQLEREKRLWEISLIEALPSALRRTLGLSVIAQVERRWHDEEFREEHGWQVEDLLLDIVDPLFEESARRWCRLKAHAKFLTETWLLAPGEVPTRAAWAEGRRVYSALSLPLSWFTDVWARDLALVDGCLVTEVTDRSPDEGRARVLAMRWERRSPDMTRAVEAPALLTEGGGGWHLHWI